MDDNAPKKIYLLCYGESREGSGEDIFWSEDRINDTDEEYYHVSEIERLRKEAEKACRVIDTFITLFFLRQDKMDYNVVDDGLRLIKKRMKENERESILSNHCSFEELYRQALKEGE